MILRYAHLRQHPAVFQAMTGLRVAEYDALVAEVLPAYAAAEGRRHSRPDRRRAIGAGHPFRLARRDQVLLTLVWLRQYPTYPVLGYLFGVSVPTVSRLLRQVLPVLADAGRTTLRMPDPHRRSRRGLDALLAETPALAVIIDTFEQRVQRPRDRHAADALYSGKKKQHTLKSQVSVDEGSGRVVDVSDSVPGPTSDVTLLKQSRLMTRLPDGVGAIGDLAYVGIATRDPRGAGATPRRKPRGKPRPPEDVAYNRAFARRRITVEHTIGRMRHYHCLTQTDRHHRLYHHHRVCAVAGLANRQIDTRLPPCWTTVGKGATYSHPLLRKLTSEEEGARRQRWRGVPVSH